MVRTVALLVGLLTAAQSSAEALDRRVPVEPGGRLQVDLDLGEEMRPERVSLDVRSHDADEVWAVAEPSGLGAASVKFRVEHDGEVVRVYGTSDGLMSWLFGGPGVHVRVWVPRHFSLDLRSTSGPIRVEDVAGDVRARTSDAAIEVDGVEGNVSLRTREGAVKVREVHGDVEIRVAEGAIEVSWVTGDVEARAREGDIHVRHVEGRLVLRSDSGEIGLQEVRGHAEVKAERGTVHAVFGERPSGLLETHRGSVVVSLPADAGLRLDARARGGNVRVDGFRIQGERTPNHVIGAVNGGGALLRVYTARGNIRVGRR